MSRRTRRTIATIVATIVGLALIWLPIVAQAGIEGSG
jgi:hypothetical protein